MDLNARVDITFARVVVSLVIYIDIKIGKK